MHPFRKKRRVHFFCRCGVTTGSNVQWTESPFYTNGSAGDLTRNQSLIALDIVGSNFAIQRRATYTEQVGCFGHVPFRSL
jgi:hypothetical protein